MTLSDKDKDKCELCGREVSWPKVTYIIPASETPLEPGQCANPIDICPQCTRRLYGLLRRLKGGF